MVPGGGLSICCDGNLRGALDDFDGSVSAEPWNGCECLVGPRRRKDGDMHKRCDGEKYGYAGMTVKGGDSAVRMQLPAFAEELKYQTGGASRVVTLSLKARAAITMAGHKGDSVTWVDGSTGAWETSSVYGAMPFVEEYAKKHPVSEDYGKTWALSLAASSYWYDEKALGAAQTAGWTPGFPHPLRGKEGSSGPDEAS